MKLIHEYAQKSSILEIIRLDVRSDNINAIHLYQKFGYEKIGCFAEEMKINGHYVSIDQMRVLLKKEN
jgi:ribosomal protein S18 acetylase RimI-like enzyme